MSLLTPLGLLGLLSIIALIIIYILKPNYQQKVISSTYVWKLSLRYKRKRIPISRFRNILIFICQVLILTSCAFILAGPVAGTQKDSNEAEKVIIIDASASMLVTDGKYTRFERAVNAAVTLTEKALGENGAVTVIIANDNPYYLAQRYTKADMNLVINELKALIEKKEALGCSYASADMETAVGMAQDVILQNPKAEVVFYSATEYVDTNNIVLENIADNDMEWNVAVLDVEVTKDDNNYCNIIVDVGCYNRARALDVYCEVFSPNGDSSQSITMSLPGEFFAFETEKTFEFTPEVQYNQTNKKLYSYESIYVYVSETDSFSEDNSFYLYGGLKELVRVQYTSPKPNNFFDGAMNVIQNLMDDTWDIEFKTVYYSTASETQRYETTGFNLYIFEHIMPEKIPTDGIVFLVDPDTAPRNAGFRVADTPVYTDGREKLELGDPHPITNMMTPESIIFTKYAKIASHDGFEEVMYHKNNPVLLVKNEPDEKVVVLALDLNFSDFSMLPEFPLFMYNLFNYFLPPTVTDFTYEVGEVVEVMGRGDSLTVSGGEFDQVKLTEFPAQIKVNRPGTYTLMQQNIVGDYVIDNFFVGISNFESNISKKIDTLPLLYKEEVTIEEPKDLLFWIAFALVALLFLEWWLQSHEYF